MTAEDPYYKEGEERCDHRTPPRRSDLTHAAATARENDVLGMTLNYPSTYKALCFLASYSGGILDSYKLLDSSGRVLGVITLETDEVPDLMQKGAEFRLGGSWNYSTNKFVHFFLLPVPVVKSKEKTDG